MLTAVDETEAQRLLETAKARTIAAGAIKAKVATAAEFIFIGNRTVGGYL
jgi:hypothetical protein